MSNLNISKSKGEPELPVSPFGAGPGTVACLLLNPVDFHRLSSRTRVFTQYQAVCTQATAVLFSMP
jgi:hypothetical protein